MIKTCSTILVHILTALYQPFWFAVLLSVMAMFLYLFANHAEKGGKGLKSAFYAWLLMFKTSERFRKLFFLVFCCTMILFQTLLNRNMWLNPLSDVMGGWWIYNIDSSTGEKVLTTECFENLILFIPFSALYLWYNWEKISEKTLCQVVWSGTKTVCFFSTLIEFLQLFLRVGTFQISDLVYNTLGGFIGSGIYCLWKKVK